MSVAYYIVLNNENPGFDAFVNGKFIGKEAKKLNALCRKLGIPKLDDFITMSAEDISDMLGEEVELPEGEGEKWFTPHEGFVSALIGHITANPADFRNAPGILEDLAEYAEVFEQARGIGAMWHLNMDI